jgi:leader peptidase (prepilin peptidase)/N-methyltransferase
MSVEMVLAGIAGVFGALLGSFLNVCVYRLPRDESVVRPRSHCPGCNVLIAWYDNIPVVSWLLLRARCRHCRAPISVRYPLVELSVAAIWAASVWWWGPVWDALAAAVLLTLLLGIVLTDAGHYIIPDEFSLGGLGAGLALSFLTDPIGPVAAALGAAAGFTVMWGVKAAGDAALRRGLIGGEEVQRTLGEEEPPSAMGGGDVKMLAMIGAFLGWQGALASVFLGALAGTLVYLPLMLRKDKPLVPFGIYLGVGAAVTLIWGDQLARWYAWLLSA